MFPIIQSACLRLLLVLIFSHCLPAAAQIVDIKRGREIPITELIAQLRAADMLLLGELHDNIYHHRERALLLTQLGVKDWTIVAEHMPVDGKPVFSASLLEALEQAGFDKKAWGWPLHEVLFEEIRNSGARLIGGNLVKGQAKELAKNGSGSLPLKMRAALERAALDAQSAKALSADLIDGHCKQLPEKYLASMQLIQRATDTSFALAMLENKKSILVAGNGHVRKDYGVPQVLHAIAPEMKVVSIGFHERDEENKALPHLLSDQYDFVWITEAVSRDDPCQGFKLK